DMARFMIAHLQGGRYENTSILGETTVEEMHRRHFTHHPKLAGICYAFLERYYNDQRILWHDGGTYGFTSLLILAPEQNLGFFVAYNIEDSTIARERLVENFFDHYFPVSKPPAPAPMPNASRERASTFAGTYRVSRHGHRGLEKLEALIGKVPETVVTANSDDGITLDGRHLVEVEPLLFQFDSGRGHVAFRQDSQGRVTHLFAGRSTAWAFERLAWYEQRQFHLALCGGTAFVFLVTLLIVPIVRRFRKPVTTPAPAVRRAWRCAYAVSGLNLLFLVCLAATLILWREEVQYQMPKPLVALLYMPVANLILTAALLLTTITLWLKRQALLATRLYHSLLSVSAVAFIWFLLHWNLLKFHY
ncbi:MAG: serine hydrolase, partial [Candidatus Hydrogenedentes bacterium]|nr:serine hydrolase [Candidatus Hydrogenedentota bacterium]